MHSYFAVLSSLIILMSGCSNPRERRDDLPIAVEPAASCAAPQDGENALTSALRDYVRGPALGADPSLMVRVHSAPGTGAPVRDTAAPTSVAEIDDAVKALGAARLVPTATGDVTLQYEQVLNDCEDRAHVAAAFLLQTRPQMRVGKVFVHGDLQTLGDRVKWGYHVAPFVAVVGADGKPSDLRVIDPAFDRSKSISLRDWLERTTHDSPEGTTIAVELTAPEVWNFSLDASKEFVAGRSADFCAEVAAARTNLTWFRAMTPETVGILNGVRVAAIEDGIVTFQGDSGRRYRDFAAPTDLLGSLAQSQVSAAPLTIRYRRLYSKNPFVNVGRVFAPGLKMIVSAAAGGHSDPAATADMTESQRERARDVIRAFSQDAGTNCATIAFAKMLLYGDRTKALVKVSAAPQQPDAVTTVTFADGASVEVTSAELAAAEALAKFAPSTDRNEDRRFAIALSAGLARRLSRDGLQNLQHDAESFSPGELAYPEALEMVMTGGVHTRNLPALAGMSPHIIEMRDQDNDQGLTWKDVRRALTVAKFVRANASAGCTVFSRGHAWFSAEGLSDDYGTARARGRGVQFWIPANAFCLKGEAASGTTTAEPASP